MANIRLPEHSHCEFCGDPVPFGERFCDDECRRQEDLRVSNEKRKDYIFYCVAGATIVILFVARYLTL